MSQPAHERSPDQVAHERAMGHVSDVLLNLEGVLAHARKAKAAVDKDGAEVNAGLALADAARDLERIRKRLMQDTYFAVDTRLVWPCPVASRSRRRSPPSRRSGRTTPGPRSPRRRPSSTSRSAATATTGASLGPGSSTSLRRPASWTCSGAVAECYGWPRSAAQDPKELVRRLTELNREEAEGGRPYAPFAPTPQG